MSQPHEPLQRIAPDVKLGRNVRIYSFTNLYGCEIGDDVKIGTFVEIQKGAKIGARCKISSHTFICEGVTLEEEVFIGHNVVFTNDRFPRATASGKLQTIDNQIDLTTGTYKLKSTFSNEDNALFPNQFVNVHLLVDTKKNLTIVPAAAIQRGPQGTYVYASGSDNTVKIRVVTIAQTTGDNVGLSAGLNPGDTR